MFNAVFNNALWGGVKPVTVNMERDNRREEEQAMEEEKQSLML
jgi:hypothetical protein